MTSSRFRLLFEHDLSGKPLRTFPDHALAAYFDGFLKFTGRLKAN
jgi:hypothetical protein